MRVTFKLFATLGAHLPAERGGHLRSGNELPVDLEEGATLQALVDGFALPPALVHLVLVNGAYVPPEARAAHRLRDGDAVAIWPPVAGG